MQLHNYEKKATNEYCEHVLSGSECLKPKPVEKATTGGESTLQMKKSDQFCVVLDQGLVISKPVSSVGDGFCIVLRPNVAELDALRTTSLRIGHNAVIVIFITRHPPARSPCSGQPWASYLFYAE